MYRLIKSNFLDKRAHATLMYIIAAIYPFVVNIFLIPIYFALFDNPEKEYAIISIVTITQSYLIISIMMGLDMSFVKHFLDAHKSETESNQIKQSFLSILILSMAINYILYHLLSKWFFEFFWGNVIDFAQYQWLIFFSALFIVVNQSAFQYFRVQEQPFKALLAVIIPFTLFGLGGVLFMTIFNASAYYCIMGRTILLGASSIPLLFILLSKTGITFRFNKKLFVYALITFLGVFIELVSSSIDKITVTKTFQLELETFGVYSLAFVYVTSVGFLITGFINAQTPSLYKAFSTPESETTKEMALKFTNRLIVLSFGINALIFLFADVISLILDPLNRLVFIKFVILLIPINLIRLLTSQYNISIYYYSKTIWFSISTVAYIGTFLLLNYLLSNIISIIYLPGIIILSTIPMALIMRFIYFKYASYYIEERKALSMAVAFIIILLIKFQFGIIIDNVLLSVFINALLILALSTYVYLLLKNNRHLIFQNLKNVQ
ncbi:MAG: hypothetical protein U0U66_12265 [Cytophagaceae bacterium]